ncbi:hypothetical protein [Planctomicrobium sp. SH664]|uniref:hypothetical protein n=1 Tax=Planctomicrobium sp. SH664 TaxID=3448125 RepID=UPI003F5BA079
MPDIEIDDDTFEWLQRSAAAEGITIDEFLLELVKRDDDRLAIKQGLDDLKSGRGRPAAEVEADLRSEAGLPPRETP